jgi:hypothetical protein
MSTSARCTRTLIEKRGRLDDQDVERFLAVGFGKDLLLEVITIVAASTITLDRGSSCVRSQSARKHIDKVPR